MSEGQPASGGLDAGEHARGARRSFGRNFGAEAILSCIVLSPPMPPRVFRTNTAHARWWEARTAVGRWLNVVRNSQRMLLSWTYPSEAHLVREFARWSAVLTPAASAYLCRRE